MRCGRIVDVDESKAKKLTYKITVDFGEDADKKIAKGASRLPKRKAHWKTCDRTCKRRQEEDGRRNF